MALQNTFLTLPLLNTQPLAAVGIDTIDNFGFQPYVDGQIIPVQPSVSGVNVPAIFGADGALFDLLQFANAPGGPHAATAQNYTEFLTENFGSAAPLIEHYYPLSAFNASPFPAFTAISTVMTQSSYLCSVYRGANTAVAKNIPVWIYVFAHSPKCAWLPGFPADAFPLIGATHTSEIPFMLGNTAHLPQPNGSCSMSPDEQALSAFMMFAWTSLAAIQQPTANATQWPRYGGPNNTVGMTFANTTSPGSIDLSFCTLWDEIDAMQVAAANNGSYAGSGTNSTGSNATGVSVLPMAGVASQSRASVILAAFPLIMAGIILVW